MAGISGKAAGLASNREKTFQGQRFDDEFGLNWIQFKWRNHDTQTGRFMQIDPLSNKYLHNSTYAFSENKVTGHVELEGLEAVTATESNNMHVRILAKDNVQKQIEKINNNGSKALELQGTVGVGVGVDLNIGPAKLTAGVSGPQLKGSINAGGNVEAAFAMASAAVNLETPIASGSYGTTFGKVTFQEGVLIPQSNSPGVDYSIGVKKDAKDKKDPNVSQNVDASALGTIGIGAKFGIFGIKFTIDLYNAGEAIINFGGALKEYTTEAAKEKLPMSSNNRNFDKKN